MGSGAQQPLAGISQPCAVKAPHSGTPTGSVPRRRGSASTAAADVKPILPGAENRPDRYNPL